MSTTPKFVRSPALWTLYALLGLYAFLQNAIGPAIPSLRDEFHLDYTFASFHISAFAAGMVLGGFLAPLVVRRIGVHKTLWGGQIGTLVGATVLVLAPNAWVSLGGILFAAITGTVGLAAIQASVGDQAGPHRGKALIEANMAASLTSAAAPAVLGLGAVVGLGWRALWPAFFLALAAALVFGLKPIARSVPDRPAADANASGPMPKAFFRPWTMIFVGVSVEWCVGFWAAEYLKGLPGGSLGLALAGAFTFQAASLAGRFLSSRLSGRLSEVNLLWMAVALTAIGFPLYWSLANPVVAFLGLVFCGLGVSNFYPVGLSLSMGAAGPQAAKAASWVPAASGSAVLLAPMALGAVADQSNLQTALFAIPIGLAAMVVLLLAGRRQG